MPRIVFVTRSEWDRLHTEAYQPQQVESLLKQSQPQKVLAARYGGSLVTALDVWLGKTEQRRLECWSLIPREQYMGRVSHKLDARAHWARDFHGLLVQYQEANYVLDSPITFLVRMDKLHPDEKNKTNIDLATLPLFDR
ncbi:hypothetical protein [Parvibium lacunae]|uniref:Uncharacterized protein n=1 Tax=Parvibium lacunae TaxID=1888893 RepID=A0A368L0F2_9BURK|nr:hypothetical protein [Parvibium lacunae]RCS57029.1 hypothetical protein DU000_09485 [Parvibium lacunae]